MRILAHFLWLLLLLSCSLHQITLGNHHQCLDQQRSALVLFQESLLNYSFASSSYSKAELWDLKTDCCSWKGIACNDDGHVTELDLSLSYEEDHHMLVLKKPIVEAVVQNLSSLTQLNLNNVNISLQGSKWCEIISHSLPQLRVLSLSNSSLSGPICPSLSNLRFLSQLYLDHNDNLSSIPHGFLVNSSDLIALNLSDCSLAGNFPNGIFILPKLQRIDISENSLLSGQLPEFPLNNSIQVLSLGLTNFDGKLPWSISNLKSLTSLDLPDCKFSGIIPPSLANLTHLVSVDLSFNDFSGSLPPFERDGVPNLSYISFYINQLSGVLPSSLFSLPSLKSLDLGRNQFSDELNEFPNASSSLLEAVYLDGNNLKGSIPRSIFELPNLVSLFLARNKFSSPVKLDDFQSLKNLTGLDLSGLSIESDNRSLSSLQLEILYMRSCNLTEFPNFLVAQNSLQTLFLDNNRIHGYVPSWIWKTNLTWLDLSHNPIDIPKDLIFNDDTNPNFPMLRRLLLSSCNITSFPKFLKNQKDLWYLDLSHNPIDIPKDPVFINDTNPNIPVLRGLRLSSCTISSFPKFLKNQKDLQYLDLSDNRLTGQIPNWIWNMSSSLYYVNLSYNSLEFRDRFSPVISFNSLYILDLRASLLHGPFPTAICNFSQLTFLDISNNHLSSQIPDCLGNMPTLVVLDIQKNNFNSIPSFALASNLRSLKINGNKIRGKMPTSLANCSGLEVLDLGDNMIRDTFPLWLGKLPALKILVLRANKFYGPIGHLGTVVDNFPMLQVMDLSSNEFTGDLSKELVLSFATMQFNGNNEWKLRYIGDNISYYKESTVIMYKGLEMHMERILTMFSCLDLSQNQFHGEIPQEIGRLKSLKALNLSHNSFVGRIPSSMWNLTEIESLDLSRNQLSGEIPPQLTSLTFLAVMNLSYNQLEGSIPRGNQFDTFENTSYEGNPRLFGPPLTRKCSPDEPRSYSPPPVDDEDSWTKHVLDWKIVSMGYGCGLVIGFSVGYTILSEMRIKWFANLEKRAKRHGRRFKPGQRRLRSAR